MVAKGPGPVMESVPVAQEATNVAAVTSAAAS
jgi:hypothetical protein